MNKIQINKVDKQQQVQNKIMEMFSSQKKINFNSVSVYCNVSKSYLYDNIVLKSLIENFRVMKTDYRTNNKLKLDNSMALKSNKVEKLQKEVDNLNSSVESLLSELSEENLKLFNKIYFKEERYFILNKLLENFKKDIDYINNTVLDLKTLIELQLDSKSLPIKNNLNKIMLNTVNSKYTLEVLNKINTLKDNISDDLYEESIKGIKKDIYELNLNKNILLLKDYKRVLNGS
jgi:hypothetical protein